MGLREEILAREPPRPVREPAPDLGVEAIWLRVWSVPERVAFLDWYAASEDHPDRAVEIHLQGFVLSACDEAGARLFGDADLPALRERHLVAASRLGQLGLVLNGLWGDDTKSRGSAGA